MTELPLSLQVLGVEVAPDVLARLLPRAPKGWKRPPTKTQTKLQVLINQEGRCKATGGRLGQASDVRFDHRPALWQRMYDPVTDDTVPSANDPKFIDAIMVERHDKLTQGSGGDSRTGDIGAAARDRRVTIAILAPVPISNIRFGGVPMKNSGGVSARSGQKRRVGGAPKRKIPSRPFRKGHRPMRSGRSN